mmetsp:Transcript_102271/g.234495  ORF Transcript_102271/g.234495 Transcript_102271/m.234495 type:complete len:545 (-) Transcript_102271:95-1729(-)
MRGLLLLPTLGACRGLRKVFTINDGAGAGAIGTENVDENQAAGIWFPIHKEEETYYYNPVRGVSVWVLPQGAITAAVQRDPAAWDNSSAPEGAIIGSTIVPLDKRKSCVPHCAWNCTQPVCEQNCKPLCPVPACETRCPKLGSGAFQGCKVNCGEPNCAMFCPETDICPNGTKVMGCPKCSTRCDKPKCVLDCANADTGCKTVCPEPTCQWDCKKPESCPKPDCHMVCEKPPDCLGGQLAVPVPMPEGWEKKGDGKAKKQDARWETGTWNSCSTECGDGIQVRTVYCSSGHDEDCGGAKKPALSRPCENHSGCLYSIGDWGECSAHCGEGTRTRDVHCSGPKCSGEKPATQEQCNNRDEACDACRVTIWGSKNFGGWEHTFEVGEYNSAELEYLGVKCDDISSLEVFGYSCEMHAFEYGDFNKAHGGWEAKFRHGKHDAHQIEQAGAKNNDISAFKVYRTDRKTYGPDAHDDGHSHHDGTHDEHHDGVSDSHHGDGHHADGHHDNGFSNEKNTTGNMTGNHIPGVHSSAAVVSAVAVVAILSVM